MVGAGERIEPIDRIVRFDFIGLRVFAHRRAVKTLLIHKFFHAHVSPGLGALEIHGQSLWNRMGRENETTVTDIQARS